MLKFSYRDRDRDRSSSATFIRTTQVSGFVQCALTRSRAKPPIFLTPLRPARQFFLLL